MKSVLAVLFFVAVAAVLLSWDARPGNSVPSWMFAVAAIPMVLVRWFRVSDSDGSDGMKGLGLLCLFVAGIGLMVVGAIGSGMRGTWGEILSPALPVGAVGFVISLIAGWWHFKD
ncbi:MULTISPECIES: hypothetical protein [unclassified Acidovorax]|uniref:hypothetical protein n=1 Tax=unclassified Acidovorax TaxID=2684926 RepID=UPI0028835515|nr:MULTISPECIES: hypothetical protein [unclassified Acidovorax]